MMTSKLQHDKKEKLIFVVITIYTFFYVIGAIATAFITNSLTLSIDGAYGLLDLILLMFSFVILKKLKKPNKKSYNFGHFKLEPLSNVIQGILILSICILGIISSSQNIIHPYEGIKDYFSAIGFAVFSFLSILIVWIWVIYYSKGLNSPMIKSDMIAFKVECVIAAGMVVGFPLELVMLKNKIPSYIYVDSIMALCLCLYLIKEPVILLKTAIEDLLDISPGSEVEQAILAEVNQFLKIQHHVIGHSKIQIRKSGRKSFAVIYYEVENDMDFETIQTINTSLKTHLETHFPEVDGIYCPHLGTAF